MSKLTLLCAIVISVISFAPHQALCATDQDIALSFYPQSLIDEFARFGEDGETLNKQVSTGRVGSLLIAAYSNRFSGAIRVIQTAGSPSVVDEVNTDVYRLGGANASLRLLDLDGDGTPEVIVRYSLMRFDEDWIFKLKDAHLVFIGPAVQKRGCTLSIAQNADYVDVDGDGTLELLVPPAGHTAETLTTIYKLTSAGFTPSADKILFRDRLVRDTAAPEDYDTVVYAQAGKNYTVRLVNGGRDGKNAVTSALVTVNGSALFTPNDFKPKQHLLQVPFVAKAENTVTVTVSGAPGSELLFLILPQ